MQEVVAPINHIKFDIENAIEQQLGVQPLPFTGMDKSGASICHFFKMNVCGRGVNCPFRHVLGDKSVVCKHWLRGLCKKGDQCEFLHEYDMRKMPECYFYSKFGRCDNKDCQYQHIDPASKIKDCPWYDRGFCKHGPLCKHKHRRKTMCLNYLVGFCLDGPACKLTHPRFELPIVEAKGTKCHLCGEVGHKANICRLNPYPYKQPEGEAKSGLVIKIPPPSDQPKSQFTSSTSTPLLHTTSPTKATNLFNEIKNTTPMSYTQLMQHNSQFRVPTQNQNFAHITCFKCGKKGHYANRCSEPRISFPTPMAINPTQM